MTTDPCACEALCPHGTPCVGGHATFPDSHSWLHCDDGYSHNMGTAYRLAYPDRQTIMIVEGCRHALGPGPILAVSRELVAHSRFCPDAFQPLQVLARGDR